MGKILGKSKTFQYWTFQSKTFKSWIFQSQTSQSSGKMNFLVPDFSVLNFTVPDFTVQLKNELFSPRLYSPIGKWTFQSQTLQSNWKTNFSVPDFWVQHQNDKKIEYHIFLIEYNCMISTWGQAWERFFWHKHKCCDLCKIVPMLKLHSLIAIAIIM